MKENFNLIHSISDSLIVELNVLDEMIRSDMEFIGADSYGFDIRADEGNILCLEVELEDCLVVPFVLSDDLIEFVRMSSIQKKDYIYNNNI